MGFPRVYSGRFRVFQGSLYPLGVLKAGEGFSFGVIWPGLSIAAKPQPLQDNPPRFEHGKIPAQNTIWMLT